MLTERESLLCAILANPAGDLPRMVYADWLDENERENEREDECKACKGEGRQSHSHSWSDYAGSGQTHFHYDCRACSGSGRVSNGFAARAEFIRVQCELAGMKFPRAMAMTPENEERHARREALRKRERELLTAENAMAWGGCSGLWNAGLKVSTYTLNYWKDSTDRNALGMQFERGFVSEVRAPLAVLVGGECERCGGNRHEYDQPGVFYSDSHPCHACHGTGTTPGIAARLVREQPVTRWVTSDKEPSPNSFGGPVVSWQTDPTEQWMPSWLPRELFVCLDKFEDDGELWLLYPSREAAIAALSTAIGKIARATPQPATTGLPVVG